MRQFRLGLTIATIAVLLLITACGGGGGSGSSSGGGGSNSRPIANAGAAQTVISGATVTLTGSGTDSDGTIASYAWTQTAGAAVTLSNAAVAAPTFVAPVVSASTVLTFSLVVTDNRGSASTASTVNITVNPIPNALPIANAGIGATVTSGAWVTLDGTASHDPNGSIASYTWTQIAGPAVTLANAGTSQPSFDAPTVGASTTLTFRLVVTDNLGAQSAPATVDVVVVPVPAGQVALSGTIRFANVPITANGLAYASATLRPARAVGVEIRYAATQAVLASGVTDAFGRYSLAVPENTNVIVRTTARMSRTGALPRWNIDVRNGVNGAVYFHDSNVIGSGSGGIQDIDIPLGISSSGTATGPRASGPFAILDTIYTAMQTILAVAPNTDFPALRVAWGPQSSGTFFWSGTPQYIELLDTLNSDTDEFDRHVIAHEFGHYIEHNFSRSDSIGGPHALGDRLDIRVAFGEGFGYAFAAIVLNDPNAYDSYVNNGIQRASHFNIESNPPASGANSGCWCSESSVWSILYDIYDDNADANDTLTLGFGPIWNVLTGAQADTPAFTSIFTFITALKQQVPASAAAIDLLLSAQNMVTNLNAYASTETTLPSPLPSSAVFPLYSTAVIGGGPITLRTVDDAGTPNRLGNHRYVRFTNNATRDVTITLSSSNPNNADPDFTLWRNGDLIWLGFDPPPGPEVQTVPDLAPGEYLLDIYDCANGCSGATQGVPGDYDLTLTLQ